MEVVQAMEQVYRGFRRDILEAYGARLQRQADILEGYFWMMSNVDRRDCVWQKGVDAAQVLCVEDEGFIAQRVSPAADDVLKVAVDPLPVQSDVFALQVI